MICTFFGHRDAPFSLKSELKSAINKAISMGATTFYVGNNGNFDLLCQQVLSEILKIRDGFNYYIVASHIYEKALFGKQEQVIFPEELEGVIKRFAICKRNEYMLKRSSFVVSYIRTPASNSYKLVEKAKKTGLTVIEI